MGRGILDFSSKTALADPYNNGPDAYGRFGHKNGGVGVMRVFFGPVLLLCVALGASSAFAQQAVVAAPITAAPVTAAPVATSTTTTTTTTAAPVTAAPVTAAPVTPAPAVAGPVPVGTPLPVSADQPPVEVQDPLAAFRQAQQDANPAVSPEIETPDPTAGGFQQPANGAVSQEVYDLNAAMSDAEIEAKEAEMQQKARELSFDSALNGMMPLSPDQIRALLDKYKVTREASEKRIGGPPKPEVVLETVSLDPGATPPIIKLSPGHVTSVNILDMTGQPWPVQDVSWGGNFEVISPGEGGHIIRVSPMASEEIGNMSVQLLGLKTPVTFSLQTQLDVVQYRFDARIPEYGPKASPPIIDPGLTIEAGGDKSLGQILDGVPPAGAEKLSVSGADARTSVYRVGDAIYLRTPLTLLSPGWSSSVKSADGMTVYVINNSPVLLLSERGKMIRAAVAQNKVTTQ